MSYDLYFIKKANSELKVSDIREYLNKNVAAATNEFPNQYLYENEDTEVYFYFEYFNPHEEESADLNFPGFTNTGIAFNINFLRPDFFGIEAFKYVDQLIDDLDLYVLDPQSKYDNPYKPKKNELLYRWTQINQKQSRQYFDEFNLTHFEKSKSLQSFQFNLNRKDYQRDLGENYFVPKVFFFKKSPGEVVRITSWTESVPCLIPAFDYILISRVKKKWFKKVAENGLINYETFLDYFSDFFEE